MDQLVGIGVMRRAERKLFAFRAERSGIELAQHGRKELAIRLAGIALGDGLLLPAHRERVCKLAAEALRHGQRALGDGEHAGETRDALPVIAQRGARVLPQRPGGDLRGDIRIAVAIAADPRAELEEGRRLEMLAGVIAGERPVEQADHLRRLLEQRLIEEVQPAQHLVLDRGLLQMQLARHPHELDLIADFGEQRLPFPLRPARVLELEQEEIDAAVFLKDRDALGLGGMRGDDRADAQIAQKVLDLARGDAVAGGLGEHMIERAAQRLAAARPLDMAAAAHGRVLLGDGEKLEPDALGLQRPGHQLGREAGNIGAAFEHRLDLGLMPANHLDEEAKQDVRGLLGRRAGDERGGACLGPLPALSRILVHVMLTHIRPLRSDGVTPHPFRHAPCTCTACKIAAKSPLPQGERGKL